jgi:hypothetical protein
MTENLEIFSKFNVLVLGVLLLEGGWFLGMCGIWVATK